MTLPARLLGLGCLFAGLLSPTASAVAQEATSYGQGTHALRALLKQKFQAVPLTEEQFEARLDRGEYANLLLVVLGDTSTLDRLGTVRLRQMIAEGGAVLAATDRRTGPVLEQAFGVTVTGDFLQVAPDSVNAYKGLADCPFVRDIAVDHPIFRAVVRIATNRPSNLILNSRYSLRTLARFPLEADLEDGKDALPNRRTEGYRFAAGQDHGAGRLLVLSDHSVFINDMVLQSDNHNFFLAINCLDWLTDGGRRNQVVFIEDGRFVTDFNLVLRDAPPLPMPSLEWLMQKADEFLLSKGNEYLANVDESDHFGRRIEERLRERHEPVVLTVLLVLTVTLAVIGFWRLSQARHRIERQDPLLAACLAQSPPARMLTQWRNEAMQRQNNYWETAHQLARQSFASVRGLGERLSGPTVVLRDAPPITVRGSWWQRRALTRRVRRLWRLACGTSPTQITAAEFRRLQDELQTLRNALADGTVQLKSG